MALGWVNIDHEGHVICLKGGELTDIVEEFFQVSGHQFSVEPEGDTATYVFPRHYAGRNTASVAEQLISFLRHLGFVVNPPIPVSAYRAMKHAAR